MSHRTNKERIRQASPVILPSLLLCDFGNLEREVARLKAANIQALHLDVMDGVFVPNLTYGMPIVAAVRRLTDLPLDVHLMIHRPGDYVDQFIDAGADLVTFHIEGVAEPRPLLERIRGRGVAGGVALNPETPLSDLDGCLDLCDLVLVMSVPAGFGAQSFDSSALERLSLLRRRVDQHVMLEVDGGVNATTIAGCRKAGADLFVVGSAIFGQEDYSHVVQQLNQLVTSSDGE
jgi:ribulose-phosphate 3-epimerase